MVSLMRWSIFLTLAIPIWLAFSMAHAQGVACSPWSRWSPVGPEYRLHGALFVDELRQRECRSGATAYRETQSRSRMVERGAPLSVIYGDTERGARVLGLWGGLDPVWRMWARDRLPQGQVDVLLVARTVEELFASEMALARRLGLPVLILSPEGLNLGARESLPLEALLDAAQQLIGLSPPR